MFIHKSMFIGAKRYFSEEFGMTTSTMQALPLAVTRTINSLEHAPLCKQIFYTSANVLKGR